MRTVAQDYARLGVTEIARTVCELLDWKRPNGGLKNHECRQLLERLQARGVLTLPALRHSGGKGPRRVDISQQRLEPEPVECLARECEPLELALVEGEAESRLWREHVERYHYLGCRVPFGANTTGCGIVIGSWPAYCGHRQPGRCRREMPGSVGAMSGGNVTCNGSSTMDGS